MRHRIEHIAGLVLMSAAAFVESLLLLFPIFGLNLWSLCIVFAVGLLLVAARTAIIWFCPIFVTMGVLLIFYVDTILFVLYLLGIGLHAVYTVVRELVEFAGRLFGHHDNMPSLPNSHLYKVSAKKAIKFMRQLPSTCAPFDSVKRIFKYTTHYFIGKPMCAFSRSMWPVTPLVGDGLSVTFAGSADPVTLVEGKNCMIAAPSSGLFYCVILNIGFVILNVVLPLVLIFILWSVFSKPIKLCGWIGLNLCIYGIQESVHLILYLFIIFES